MRRTDAPAAYERNAWQQILNVLGSAIGAAFMKGEDVQLARGERLILRSPSGAEWVCGPDDAGNWSCAPKP